MIRTPVHRLLDIASAAALLIAPAVLHPTPRTARTIMAVGVGLAAVTALTRYSRDQRKPIPMKAHLMVDAVQGAGFLAAGLALRSQPKPLRAAMAGYGAFSLAVVAASERNPQRSTRQIPLPRSAVTGQPIGGALMEVASDIAYRRLGIVNVAFLGTPGAGDRGWVLIDAGLRGSARAIAAAAAHRFGPTARPAAIILTHGHFDHVGALKVLSEKWEAPIYAHPLEHPYLVGLRSYPEAAPETGGGLMSALSPLYPRHPIDVTDRLFPLPPDGSIPGAPGWQWLHTPGHTPGHVALWRASDRTLLSGDAIITTRQESAASVTTQAPEIHGPPAYFTPDWQAAENSIRLLAGLRPARILSGHGRALSGPALLPALDDLARLDLQSLFSPVFNPEGLPAFAENMPQTVSQ